MMRRFLVALTMTLAILAGPVSAQDRRSEAIAAVIDDQMAAFVARDVARAWEHASPMIQNMFRTPENFGQMVERGYPMVWNNAEVRFLELREIDGRLWQKVMIRDASGGLHILDYQMVETSAGWLINGVQILPAPDTGV